MQRRGGLQQIDVAQTRQTEKEGSTRLRSYCVFTPCHTWYDDVQRDADPKNTTLQACASSENAYKPSRKVLKKQPVGYASKSLLYQGTSISAALKGRGRECCIMRTSIFHFFVLRSCRSSVVFAVATRRT